MTQKERDVMLHTEEEWIEIRPIERKTRVLELGFRGRRSKAKLIRVQALIYEEDWINWRENNHPMITKWKDIGLFIEDAAGNWKPSSWTGFKEAMKEADRPGLAEA